jgi:hypothetical protein
MLSYLGRKVPHRPRRPVCIIRNMYFKSKKIPLLILGATSLVCSRGMFIFFDDPEGPNLLVVTVMALIIYLLSMMVYLRTISPRSVLQQTSSLAFLSLRNLLVVILIQITLALIFWFCL